MIHVVLDSTALIGGGPTSGPFRDLAKCTRVSDDVKIHVPEIVVREAATNIAHKAASTKAEGLMHVGNWQEEDEVRAALKTLNRLKKEREEVAYEIASAIEEWVESSGGVVQPLSKMDAGRVFEDYFDGAGPFTGAPKERSRIPDAFIFHYVADLAEGLGSMSEEEVMVVTNDQALAKNLQALRSVQVYSTVSELITTSSIRRWTAVGGLRVHDDYVEMLIEDVAMRLTLPGDEIYTELRAHPAVEIKLDEAHESEGVVYLPFRMVFDTVMALSYDEESGDVTEESIGPVAVTGMTRGEVKTDPDGDKWVTNLHPATFTATRGKEDEKPTPKLKASRSREKS